MSNATVSFKENGEVVKPILVNVREIESTFDPSCFIVYYQIPLTSQYCPIKKIKGRDLFLPSRSIEYKAINYLQKTEEYSEKESDVKISGSNGDRQQLTITTCFSGNNYVKLSCLVVNQAHDRNLVADVSLNRIEGYSNFYEYRKKYKTLENITRNITFTLDHRLRLRDQTGEEFYFSMDELKEHEVKNWFLNWSPRTEVSLYLEEIVSVADVSSVKVIDEAVVSFKDSLSPEKSYLIEMKTTQYLTVEFRLNAIKNANLSKYEFVALRVLEATTTPSALSRPSQKGLLYVGTSETVQTAGSCLCLKPLMDEQYYDLEYGYLNKNLKSLKDEQIDIHEYLGKLTKSDQKYQHFQNQKVLDLTGFKDLAFRQSGDNFTAISIPVVYLLEGYNVFHQEDGFEVRFLLEIQENLSEESLQKDTDQLNSYVPVDNLLKTFPRKLLSVSLEDILNLGEVIEVTESSTHSNFERLFLKLKCESTVYWVEFEVSEVEAHQLKAQSKQLELRTQHSQFIEGQFMMVRQAVDNKAKVLVVKSLNLQQFYLFEVTDSTPITVEIVVENNLIMHCSVPKKFFLESPRTEEPIYKALILTSCDNRSKSVVRVRTSQIDQQIEGLIHNFRFKYQVVADSYAENIENSKYDIELYRIWENELGSKRKSKDRLQASAEVSFTNEEIDRLQLKSFGERTSFYLSQQSLCLGIRMRRVFYNQALDIFDNEAIVNKKLLLNRDSLSPAESSLNDQSLLNLQLQADTFRGIEFEVYDQTIHKKITLYIEIYHHLEPFGVGGQYTYRLKVPSALWKMNFSHSQGSDGLQPSIEFAIHHSTKRTKDNKKISLIYNSAQQHILSHFNYNDGLSLKVETEKGTEFGYAKVRECLKAKCETTSQRMQPSSQAEWYLGVINLARGSFYFFIKMQFDINAQRDSSNDSRASQKTQNKEREEKSNEKTPDLMAKTMKNFDLVKLKQLKNGLEQQNRQLTTKHVQKQEMIVYLNKKITEAEEIVKKRKEEVKNVLEGTTHGRRSKKQSRKINSFYRSICECGVRDPEFMGYCRKCLEAMQKRYETFFLEYQEKSSAYEKMMFDRYNIRSKIEHLKTRINHYKQILNGTASSEAVGASSEQMFEKLEEKHMKVEIEELRLELFEISQEKESQFERRAYQMGQLEAKIKKEDDLLWERSQQLNTHKAKLNDLIRLTNKGSDSTADE